MTRQEKINSLREEIEIKQAEINSLKSQLSEEIVANFYETHGLSEGQHFMYGNKKCAGVEYDGISLRTHSITKSGELSRMATIIYDESIIKTL